MPRPAQDTGFFCLLNNAFLHRKMGGDRKERVEKFILSGIVAGELLVDAFFNFWRSLNKLYPGFFRNG